MDATVMLTAHAIERAHERFHLKSADPLYRQIENAWSRGVTADTAETAAMRSYISTNEQKNTAVRIYNNKVFVFATDTELPMLITVFPVPKYLFSSPHYRGEKVFKFRKFYRMHPELLN